MYVANIYRFSVICQPRTTPTCSPGLVPSDQRYQASQQSVSDFYQAVPSSRFPSVSRLDESDSVVYPSISDSGLPSSSQGIRPVGAFRVFHFANLFVYTCETILEMMNL